MEQPLTCSLSGEPHLGRTSRLPLLVTHTTNKPSAVQDMSANQNVLQCRKCIIFRVEIVNLSHNSYALVLVS